MRDSLSVMKTKQLAKDFKMLVYRRGEEYYGQLANYMVCYKWVHCRELEQLASDLNVQLDEDGCWDFGEYVRHGHWLLDTAA